MELLCFVEVTAPNGTIARDKAREKGWAVRYREDGKAVDLCPGHLKRYDDNREAVRAARGLDPVMAHLQRLEGPSDEELRVVEDS